MMKWFVEDDKVESVLRNSSELIEEEEVETRPERLPDAILDENVDIFLIRRFFSSDSWLLVMETIKVMKKKHVYICKTCYHDLHDNPSIVCDHCLSWYHIHCVGLKEQGPKSRYWFCRRCHDSPLC